MKIYEEAEILLQNRSIIKAIELKTVNGDGAMK